MEIQRDLVKLLPSWGSQRPASTKQPTCPLACVTYSVHPVFSVQKQEETENTEDNLPQEPKPLFPRVCEGDRPLLTFLWLPGDEQKQLSCLNLWPTVNTYIVETSRLTSQGVNCLEMAF